MKTFTFTLNCQVQAQDAEQALKIAEDAKAFLTLDHNDFPWKIQVEIDDVEEA